MKEKKLVAISSEGPSLDDQVDPRFGRAAGFILIDPDTREFEYIDNGATQVMAQGAGIHAAQLVANARAGVVLTGFVGPKAFDALGRAEIEVGQDLQGLPIKEAFHRYTLGLVEMAKAPNSKGHGRLS